MAKFNRFRLSVACFLGIIFIICYSLCSFKPIFNGVRYSLLFYVHDSFARSTSKLTKSNHHRRQQNKFCSFVPGRRPRPLENRFSCRRSHSQGLKPGRRGRRPRSSPWWAWHRWPRRRHWNWSGLVWDALFIASFSTFQSLQLKVKKHCNENGLDFNCRQSNHGSF